MTEPQNTSKRVLRAYGWAGVSTPQQARDEKESLPAQRRDIQAAAHQLGVDLLDILEVPGFSRNYIDFHEMRDDMARQGISAPARLQSLWESKAIDIFICKDADRFGRTIPILSYIAAQLVFTGGARIFVVTKGLFIDRDNFNMFISMFGLMAADEVKRLRDRHEMGMRGRFTRGLPGARIPFTHRLVGERDERTLVVDPDKLPLLNDLADLVLQGVPYLEIPTALRARGHVNPETGQAYSMTFPRLVLYNPFTWGHVARRFKYKRGTWVYDVTAPVPPGVEVRRDVVPAVFTGDIAVKLQAELRRREAIIKGRASPTDTHRYRGVLRCAQCGMGMVYNSHGYYFCCRNYQERTIRGDAPECSNRKFIRENVVNEQVGEFLYRWITSAPADLSLPGEDTGPDTRLATLEAESKSVETRLRRLIHLQANAPLTASEIYQAEVKTLADRLDYVRNETIRVKALRPSPAHLRDRKLAFEEIAAHGVTRFLEQSDRKVNQALHRILGQARFLVDDGEIKGLYFPDR